MTVHKIAGDGPGYADHLTAADTVTRRGDYYLGREGTVCGSNGPEATDLARGARGVVEQRPPPTVTLGHPFHPKTLRVVQPNRVPQSAPLLHPDSRSLPFDPLLGLPAGQGLFGRFGADEDNPGDGRACFTPQSAASGRPRPTPSPP